MLRMVCLARSCVVFSASLLLPACASLPSATAACDSQPGAAVVGELSQAAIAPSAACAASSSRSRAVGRVEQRGSQTRTVGVPRGFLIAMIVLIVVFGLA